MGSYSFADVFLGSFLAIVYRKALLDIHERPLSIFAKNIAQLMQLKLVTNFEYIIYRATLDRYELMRLKINTNNLTKTLIFIEDRSFLKHHGFCFKASIRALLGLLYIKRRSGGSTITQQLVRTLFIHDQSKLFRRKTIEIILSLSFNRVFSKIEQIELYLASVRFERGVYGVIQAMNFYWGSSVEKTSMAESFLLIERVSNIYSRLLAEKIFQTVKSAMKEGLLTRNDIKELHKLYSDAIASEKI